jgi:hypothetical protein
LTFPDQDITWVRGPQSLLVGTNPPVIAILGRRDDRDLGA